MNGASLILLWIGLAIGSVLYQAFTHGQYAEAWHDSYYMGIALLAAWINWKVFA
jgi:hypothetical protein